MYDKLERLKEVNHYKDICVVIDKIILSLNSEIRDDEVVLLYKEFFDAIDHSYDYSIYYKVFPILVDLACENIFNIPFLYFITNVKYNISMISMNLISDEEVSSYLDALYRLDDKFTFEHTIFDYTFNDLNKVGLKKIDQFYFVHCAHIINTHTNDGYAYFKYGLFNNDFEVSCARCNHKEVLNINDGKIVANKKLELNIYNERKIWRIEALTNVDLLKEAEKVSKLEGSYVCSNCGAENVPSKAAGKHIHDNHRTFEISEKYLLRLKRILIDKIDYEQVEWYDRLIFNCKYLSALYIEYFGENDLKSLEFLLKNAISVYEYYGDAYIEYLTNSALKQISSYSEVNEEIADLYTIMGLALSFNKETPQKDLEVALSYSKKACDIYDKLLGEDNEKSLVAKKNYYYKLAERLNGKIYDFALILEKMYKTNKFNELDLLKSEERLARLYDLKGEYNNALELRKIHLSMYRKLYGDGSSYVAEVKRLLAETYRKMGNEEMALNLLNEALETHISYMNN